MRGSPSRNLTSERFGTPHCGRGARRASSSPGRSYGCLATSSTGGPHGPGDRAVRRPGCPSREHRGLCPRPRPEWGPRPSTCARSAPRRRSSCCCGIGSRAHGVTHVAMESTGVYWKPVYYLLEEGCVCLLVNAAHIKQVPGRKTDVKDCVWIADLLEHGLLRGSFVPPPFIRDLRDLTRYRRVLIDERTREVESAAQSCCRTRELSWPRWPRTSSGCRAAPCWRRSSRAPPTPRCWRTSPGASCGASCRPCARPSHGRFRPTSRLLWPASSSTRLDELDDHLDTLTSADRRGAAPFCGGD